MWRESGAERQRVCACVLWGRGCSWEGRLAVGGQSLSATGQLNEQGMPGPLTAWRVPPGAVRMAVSSTNSSSSRAGMSNSCFMCVQCYPSLTFRTHWLHVKSKARPSQPPAPCGRKLECQFSPLCTNSTALLEASQDCVAAPASHTTHRQRIGAEIDEVLVGCVTPSEGNEGELAAF